MVEKIVKSLIFLNNIGFWELLNFILVISGIIAGSIYFSRRQRIPMFNIFTHHSTRAGSNYTSLINIEFRNYVGCSLVVCNPYFKYKDLRPDSAARRDSLSGETEVKFQGKNGGGLTEIEVFIPHKENVATWVPIDPTHTQGEINTALDKKRVGILYFTCIWIKEKPKVKKVAIKI